MQRDECAGKRGEIREVGRQQTHEDTSDDTRDAPDQARHNGDGQRDPVATEDTRSDCPAHKKDRREADEVPEHERDKNGAEVRQGRRERDHLAKRPVHLITSSKRCIDHASQSIHDSDST